MCPFHRWECCGTEKPVHLPKVTQQQVVVVRISTWASLSQSLSLFPSAILSELGWSHVPCLSDDLHPLRAWLRKSKALSPSEETRHCSQSWLPGQAEGHDNCSVGSGALFAYMQIGGLISCSPRWVSSGLGLTPAWPGLKASLASGTHAQPDGGLSRQGWPVALAAEGSSQDLNVLLGEPEAVI